MIVGAYDIDLSDTENYAYFVPTPSRIDRNRQARRERDTAENARTRRTPASIAVDTSTVPASWNSPPISDETQANQSPQATQPPGTNATRRQRQRVPTNSEKSTTASSAQPISLIQTTTVTQNSTNQLPRTRQDGAAVASRNAKPCRRTTDCRHPSHLGQGKPAQ